MKICIKFVHGLGDTISFYPIFEYLQKTYPDVNMSLYTSIGQEEYFGKVSCDEKDYDIVFEIKFPCCEFNPSLRKYTKPQLSCIQEIGIDYSKIEEYSLKLRPIKSPLVAFHFQSTACPFEVSTNQQFAQIIHKKIIENGLIPIEVFFKHQNYNPRNKKYDFISCTARECQSNINSLIGLMQHCCGFVGCGSGPFHLALCLYPDKTLYLENRFPCNLYTHSKNILSINVNKQFDEDIFDEWINRLKN